MLQLSQVWALHSAYTPETLINTSIDKEIKHYIGYYQILISHFTIKLTKSLPKIDQRIEFCVITYLMKASGTGN